MAYEEGHRAYILTPTDRSGLIVIVTTLFMSWMVLCFLTRLYTRWAINGPFGLDDLAAGIGTVRTSVCYIAISLPSDLDRRLWEYAMLARLWTQSRMGLGNRSYCWIHSGYQKQKRSSRFYQVL